MSNFSFSSIISQSRAGTAEYLAQNRSTGFSPTAAVPPPVTPAMTASYNLPPRMHSESNNNYESFNEIDNSNLELEDFSNYALLDGLMKPHQSRKNNTNSSVNKESKLPPKIRTESALNTHSNIHRTTPLARSSKTPSKMSQDYRPSITIGNSKDVWNRLVEKEKTTRQKYQESSKNIILLEKEQEKYSHLENEYKKFARDTLRERKRLLRELAFVREQAEQDVSQFQTMISNKQAEIESYNQRHSEQIHKLEDIINALKEEREKISREVQDWKQVVDKQEKQSSSLKNTISKLSEDNQRANDKISNLEASLKELKSIIEEKDLALDNGKAAMIKRESYIQEIEHGLSQLDEECKSLRRQMYRKDTELQAAAELGSTVEKQKRLLKDASIRENELCNRISDLQTIERKRMQQVSIMQEQEQRYLNDIQRLSQSESSLKREIDKQKSQYNQVAKESVEWREKFKQQNMKSEELSLALDKAVSDVNQYQKLAQITKHEHELAESKINSLLEEHRKHEIESNEALRNLQTTVCHNEEEKNRLQLQLQRLSSDFSFKTARIEKLEQQIKELDQNEQEGKQKYRDLSAEFENIQTRNSQMKSALDRSNSDVKRLREVLDKYKQQQKDSDDAHEKRVKSLLETQDKLKRTNESYVNALAQYERQEKEYETLIHDKQKQAEEDLEQFRLQLKNVSSERDQLLIESKNDRKDLREQIQSIRQTYEEKLAMLEKDRDRQIGAISEQFKQVEIQLAEANEHRKLLLKKTDHYHLEREIDNLKRIIQQKDDDIKLIQLKNRNANEHFKRLQIEKHQNNYHSASSMLRAKSSSRGNNNNEESSVQGAGGLTRRLKEEVEGILMSRDRRKQEKSIIIGDSTEDLRLSSPYRRRS